MLRNIACTDPEYVWYMEEPILWVNHMLFTYYSFQNLPKVLPIILNLFPYHHLLFLLIFILSVIMMSTMHIRGMLILISKTEILIFVFH